MPADYAGTTVLRALERSKVFGAARVMFGTDYGPVPIDPREHVDIVDALAISDADKEKWLKKGLAQQISKSLGDRFSGASAFEILRVESVGPRVGKDLRRRLVLPRPDGPHIVAPPPQVFDWMRQQGMLPLWAGFKRAVEGTAVDDRVDEAGVPVREIVVAYFSSTSGGHTESVEYGFPGAKPVLTTSMKSVGEVMAIGDNFNDVEMLEFAGTAVVMGNADPSLLERQEFYTTLSNDESGVAAAIERFILSRK